MKKTNEHFAFLLSENKCFMSPSINWAEYFEAMGLLLTGYYLFTGIKFHSQNLKDRLTGKRRGTMHQYQENVDSLEKDTEEELVSGQPGLFDEEDGLSFTSSEKDETKVLFSQAEELSSKLKVVIATAANKKYAKVELIYFLKTLLQKYTDLNIPAYRIAINNLIASECEKFGNHLNAEELARLWVE